MLAWRGEDYWLNSLTTSREPHDEQRRVRKKNVLYSRAASSVCRRYTAMRELQAQTENVVGRLAHATLEGLGDVNAKIDSLVDSQIRLTEAQTLTDGNLRNLIAVVDRYFSEGRNGK